MNARASEHNACHAVMPTLMSYRHADLDANIPPVVFEPPKLLSRTARFALTLVTHASSCGVTQHNVLFCLTLADLLNCF